MKTFNSIEKYEKFIYQFPDQYTEITFSTLVLKRYSKYIGELSGTLFFKKNVKLSVKELIDFRKCCIKAYSYDVFIEGEKQYWYDSQPHPNDSSLQLTFPHHKHIHPDIRHNRIPAKNLSFQNANLPFIIKEIIDSL